MTSLAGLVLCGGTSRRMGRDKALLEVNGRPLVRLVAERLAEVADPVLLAPGSVGRFGHLGFDEVADWPPGPGAGPLPALGAGLAAADRPLMAAVAVDMPFASPAVFRLLAGRWRGEQAVVPVTASGPQPLHAIYSRSALPAIRVALDQGRLALLDLLGDLDVLEVAETEWTAADPAGRFAWNLNRPDDLVVLDRKGSAPSL